MNQIPEEQSYLNNVAAEIPAALREDGFLPAELPKWESPRRVPPPTDEELNLTPTTNIRLVHLQAVGFARLQIWKSCYSDANWQDNISNEVRRAAALCFLLAETEKALPVLRAMVGQSIDLVPPSVGTTMI